MRTLGIVVPCFNEEEALPETARRLAVLLEDLQDKGKIGPDSRVYFVDDGSRDASWQTIRGLAETYGFVRGMKLSRNQGHQSALLAGLMHARGDCLISIDADLQDDLAAIESMLDAHAAGADIVYGVRKSRKSDSLFKRWAAEWYYRILALMGVEVVFNHADYRLMSRRAIDALREFGEVNLFLRGIIPKLGFNTATVYYDRAERIAGESKYPLRKMLGLALQGVTSFSVFPLRVITFLGFLISAVSFLVVCWVLWVRFVAGEAVPGWSSILLPMSLLGGIQLLSLGVIGEYLGKIYLETKRRPRYFIQEVVARDDQEPVG
ncbi:glycosyltransferase family 2 protein [Methylococcus sp. ANG]|uniref:glycosyltransferase family 2 protein n=1 Tax=Methylococcus sp. ANG TaxID=3231903 RepID=UPI0034596686